VSEDQELIPIEQHTENGEQLTQSGLEEAEATSERALVPLQVSQVDFYGDGLMVVLVEIGGESQVLVPLRQFCQYLGVDWASQYQRTKRDEILAREMAVVVITTTAGPGQRVFAAAASSQRPPTRTRSRCPADLSEPLGMAMTGRSVGSVRRPAGASSACCALVPR
jgi:predicted ribonuclease YlaK